MLDNILYGPSWQEGGLADDIRHISARTFHPNRVDKVAIIKLKSGYIWKMVLPPTQVQVLV